MKLLVLALVALAVSPSPAAAATPVVPISSAEGSFGRLAPVAPGRLGGTGPAEVGDVNGDGLVDIAIPAPVADPLGRRDAGVVHVVYGGSPLGRISLRSGFRIRGPRQGARRPVRLFDSDGPPGPMAGASVAGLGDVNGDGLGDIVVGVPFVGNRSRAYSGSAYVVFGKRSAEPVDLDRLGSGGYRIDGPRRDAAAGLRVAGPGDVNGDGRPDVVVSAGRLQRASVYVVFGKRGTAPVDLRRLEDRGYAIRGGRRSVGDAGAAVSGAGDFNGDGISDIAVGAPQSGTAGREGAGFVFVIFGRRDAQAVDLARLGDRGVRIDGEHEFANFGESLAPLGDTNGDGRGDLLVGASQVTALGRDYAGAAYVVLGGTTSTAYRILGPPGDEQARAGVAVAALGDVNGDGRRDILIGAPGASRHCSPEEGAAYVVFTPAAPTPIDLSDLGAAGYAIRGVPGADTGWLVAGAGDWNRDGRGDALVVRGDYADSEEDEPAPRLDLVLGREPPPVPAAPAQPPTIEIPEPSLRDLRSRRGLEGRITLSEAGPGDTVLAELRYGSGEEEVPLAVGYARVSGPGTTTIRFRTGDIFRRFLRSRTRLPLRVVFSQCTAAGYEHAGAGEIVLR